MEQLTRPWTEDPDFVRLYDVENQGLWDVDFYRDLMLELGARHMLDIGCGTGVFAVELAHHGVRVTGVDPAKAMIDIAKQRVLQAGLADRVELIQGTTAEVASSSLRSRSSIACPHGGQPSFASEISPQAPHPTRLNRVSDGTEPAPPAARLDQASSVFDAAIMMGHVAQYFLSRTDWDTVLSQTFQALKPGGWLSFESRNPEGMSADAWDEESTRQTQPHPDGGEFTSWLEVVSIVHDDADGPLITARGHNVFPDGRHVSADEPLRYRPLTVLLESLRQTGFEVKKVWGDWDRSPVEEDSPELIVLARRPS